MGFFTKKKEKPCKEGAVCAWEYRGILYPTKEGRDKAERSFKYNEAVYNLARYLEKPPNRRYYCSPVEYPEDLIEVYDTEVRGHRIIQRGMSAKQVAHKLIEEWPSIRDEIDSIVRMHEDHKS